MENLPEHADRRQFRVSDADRDKVTEVLRQAAEEGRLTFDELDERLGQALSAKTYADLEAVTTDLPAGLTAPAPAQAGLPDRVGGTPGATFSVAVMSSARRAGSWVVPHRYTAVAIMGGVDLDLRYARFAERVVTIQAFCLMGGVTIIVPSDVEVDVSGFAFMGGFDHRVSGPGRPGAPVVRVTGFALMGGVDVRRKPAPDQLT